MNINLQILKSAYVYEKEEIKELNTKVLVPKMVQRRRLTRAAKIAIFLADQVSYQNERILYGSSFGELPATANILNSIAQKEQISPTHFQNSVYNTAVSYLSMLSNNENEILTISSGDKTSLDVLKVAAIKADKDETMLLLATETLNIKNIHEVNDCTNFLEAGVALRVKLTTEPPTLKIDTNNPQNLPSSLIHMINIAQTAEQNSNNIIQITL